MLDQAAKCHVSEPKLPRKKRAPARYEQGEATPEYPADAKSHYRYIFFEAIDAIKMAILSKFDQADYGIYLAAESLLLRCCNNKDYSNEFGVVTDFYGNGFNKSNLRAHLETLSANFRKEENTQSTKLLDVNHYMRSFSKREMQFINEVCRLLKIGLVMPAANASSERSFSSLRRLKTYLRTTMTQQRLNHCMHVFKCPSR